MFERLAEAIEEMDVPVDGAALVALLGLADRLTARVIEAVGEYDAAGLCRAEGAVSTTAWLSHYAAAPVATPTGW